MASAQRDNGVPPNATSPLPLQEVGSAAFPSPPTDCLNNQSINHSICCPAGISSANSSNNNYSSLGGSSSRSSESANKKRRLTRNTLLLGLLMLLVLAAVIVIVFVELSRERPVLRSGDRAIYFGNNLDDGTCK